VPSELFENQIAIERRELAEDLQGEHEELALIYRNKVYRLMRRLGWLQNDG